MPVKWGILSTARINRLLIAGARQSPDVEIVAVASRSSSRAESYALENGIERAHGSYEALLSDPEVEVVYISLPNSMHVEWTVRALEAGKHVLCEKPLSRRAEAAELAFDTAERQQRVLMEAFMYRHNPQTFRLVELVRGGAVGRLGLIRAAFSFAARDSANIRLSTELDGGALMDVGCYCVNGARLIGGEPVRVSAEQVSGGDGVDVVFAATMRFPGDVVAQFDCGLALAARDELEVVGEDGSLFLDDPWHCRVPVIELRREQGVERIELPVSNSYRLEAENMSAAVRGEASALLGRDDAVGQARAIEALFEAADSGRGVTLSGR
ncbi:MAG TPA: Gfo/Idh/MocA family oxidoreductase [Solirubrobacteraceae bacterium]